MKKILDKIKKHKFGVIEFIMYFVIIIMWLFKDVK